MKDLSIEFGTSQSTLRSWSKELTTPSEESDAIQRIKVLEK